jgi:hypothetical protein
VSDLLFTRPPRVPGAAPDLLFGDDSSAAPPARFAVGALRLGAPQVAAQALYDNRNPARAQTAPAMAHQVAAAASAEPTSSWQRSARTAFRCAGVSMPSAVVDMSSLTESSTMERMISEQSARSVASVMKTLSILIWLIGVSALRPM